MTKAVKKHSDFLSLLKRLPPRQRQSLLKMADKEHIETLSEIADNTLKGHVPLNKVQKKKLGRHKRMLRGLACRSTCWRKKKKILCQCGGSFLPMLIAPVLSAIIGAFTGK